MRSAVALVFLALFATTASAQQVGSPVEIAFGLAQSKLESDAQCERCGLGGSPLGGLFVVNFRFEPRFRTGVAILAGSTQGRAIATFDGARVESQTSQEEIVVHWFGGAVVSPQTAHFEVVLVGGLGATFRETHREGPFLLVEGTPKSLRVPSVSNWLPTAVGEVNIPIRLTRFFSVIPSVQVRHTLGADSIGFRDHGVGNTAVTTALMIGFRMPERQTARP